VVAAINPDDLDALDESLPLTKGTIDNLIGRKITNEEYKKYWDLNPHGNLYTDLFTRFRDQDTIASKIVSATDKASREHKAGYVDGKKPASGNMPAHGVFQKFT
jgi:hypothetical protein